MRTDKRILSSTLDFNYTVLRKNIYSFPSSLMHEQSVRWKNISIV